MTEITKKKSKKTLHAACLLVLLILAAAMGITWAYYSDEMSLVNPLSTSHSEIAMVEEFNPDSSFLPGETVIKKVAFENTGDMDLFLRVKVPPQEGWYDGSSASELLDQDIWQTGNVTRNWNTSVWSEDGSETDYWTEEIQGYRYYKRVLPAKKTTDQILDSITLSPEISNDRHSVDYSDKIYKLTFEAEAVPVDASEEQVSVQAEWGMEVSGVTADGNGVLTWKVR